MRTNRDRRRFLGQLTAVSGLYCSGLTSHASAKDLGLPPRGHYLIRGAHVISMDPSIGDLPAGDVEVKNGVITAIGKKLNSSNATAIDGREMLLLPGFVETHWHMWNTLLRSMSADKREFGYFPTSAGLGKVFNPNDMYHGTRLAATEAIYNGITTVHDWCHNIRNPSYAEADLRALRESGIRARFSYGSPQGHSPESTIDLEDFERLHKNWTKYSSEGLIRLGLAWRGAYADPKLMAPNEAARKEFELARRLDLPISIHVNNSKSRAGQIAALAKENFLGKDVQLIHAIWVTPEELKNIASSGASVSFSPYTEMRIGFGFPQTGEFIAAGIPVGFSVDTIALSGNADMFAIMKAIQNIENGRSENEFKLPPRKVLEMATIEGAKTMGISDTVGSITPGKRADLIMVSTRAINMFPVTDPMHMLIEAAQPSNVDTVMIDGRILKRNGNLVGISLAQLRKQTTAALDSARKRANWW